MNFIKDKERHLLVPDRLTSSLDVIVTTCPACKVDVDFTKEQLQEYTGHHFEVECPHCGKFCCFVCEYIYI